MGIFLFPSFLFAGEFTPRESLSSWQIWLTACVGIAILVGLIKDLFPPYIVMLIGAGTLVLSGVVSPVEFAGGFFKQVIFILAFLFVIIRALEVNGILGLALKYLSPKTSKYPWQIATLMGPVGAMSAFLNNTPLVMLFTPVLQKWAAQKKLYASRYLIPLSYAAILGGSCTLIGSSTNLVVSSLLYEQVGHHLTFFELGKVGLPALIIGIIYVSLVGKKLLPKREDVREEITKNKEREIKEFEVEESCEFIGRSIASSSDKYFEGRMLVEIERAGKIIYSPDPSEKILLGDRLVFLGELEDIARLHSTPGLRSCRDPHFDPEGFIPHIIEAVITQESSLIGKSLRSVDFRKSYGGLVLAILRKGKRLPSHQLKNAVLHVGDTLLVLVASEESLKNSPEGTDLCYIRERRQLSVFSKSKALFSLGFLIIMIFLAFMGVPVVYGTMGTVIALLLTRCISPVEVKHSIRWSLLLLIGSAYTFGLALEKTGIASQIAKIFVPFLEISPRFFIAGTFILISIVTEIITNTAAVLIIFPILVQIAHLAGYDDPAALTAIAVTTAIGGSCAFSSPIGYQTNTIVYGPGGYRFLDYAKIGFPLTVIMLILCVFLIPYFWPF